MRALEDAMAEIERARDDVSNSDVRTELDSIVTSLREMLDTATGEQTDADGAFGDVDFDGAAPRPDHLLELEENLRKLADNVEDRNVRDHLETARSRIADYRGAAEEET